MSESHSKKSAHVYEVVRRDLRAGRYPPGTRIDPGTLAETLDISPTPVRLGLYRLVGEGMIADHGRAGLLVPLPTEVTLHELYDLMARQLAMACDLGHPADVDAARTTCPFDGEVVLRTWELFDAIGAASGQRTLHRSLTITNDRLAPIRHAKKALIEDAEGELLTLQWHWNRGELRALRAGLRAYHLRRRALVPRIVALLNAVSEPVR